MARAVRSLLAACVLACSAGAQQAPSFGHHFMEEGCLDGRGQYYVRRYGKIDAQTKLELTRELYESSIKSGRYTTDAIPGSTWTSIGPHNKAGRISRIAVHPTVAGTFLAGSAGGGVWRTTDGGVHWTPLTDALPNLHIGAVAYAPSNPSIIYAGTGEGDTGSPWGIGLIWSSDGGATWSLPSAVLAGAFYAISVDPRNASILVVATLNGAYRSTTGPNGPWTQVIHSSFVTDLDRDPSNPDVLYAASAPQVLKSTNGGATWGPASSGLQVQSQRIAIAIAPSSPSTLYCATSTYDSNTGVSRARIFKTTNGAASWTETQLASSGNSLINNYLIQTWYDNAIAVSPSNPDLVVAGGVHSVRTTDGGSTWSSVLSQFDPNSDFCHVDIHDLVYDAAGTLHVANDGGIWTSTDNAATAVSRNNGLVTRQFYKLAIDPTDLHRTYGGTQDNATNRRRLDDGLWDDHIGGDGGGCVVNANVPSYFIGSVQNGFLARTSDILAGTPYFNGNFPAFGTPREITNFICDIESDPHDGNTAYMATRRLWKTTTFGDSWYPLPTTTTDGGTWPSDNPVDAFAVSGSDPNVIMVAVHTSLLRSTDGGMTWRHVNGGGLPPALFNSVTIDPNDAQTAWVATTDGVSTGVYRTTNGGSTWTLRNAGLPMFAPLVLRVDPTDSATIYCGTEVGLYRSNDHGFTWQRVTGLPAAAVHDMRISPDSSIVRVATHGRGVWQLDVPVANTPPTATISSPAVLTTVSRGTQLTFSGNATDTDDGDSATGQWTFPDTWETIQTPPGASTVTHAFHTVGTFPVTLRARDQSGSMAATNVVVQVQEPADSCTSPITIPGSGPFPASVRFSTVGTTQGGADPNPLAPCAQFTGFNTVHLDFTPAESGTYEFSVCGSGGGAGIVLYTGNACGPYTPVPNGCLLLPGPKRDCATDPRLSVSLTAGVPVRILATPYNDVPNWMSVTVSRAPIALAATAVVPRAGSSAGGTEVVIEGSGFSTGATVTFGGTPASNVQVMESTAIIATAPAHAAGTVDVVVTSGGGSAMNSGGFTYTGSPLPTPQNLVASATNASIVAVTWQAVSGVAHYELYRRSNGSGYALLGPSALPSFSDHSVVPGTAYVYKVRAIGIGGATSADSNPDLATTIVFADDPLAAGATPIKAVHLSELRTAVAAVRSAAGLPPTSFTGPASPGTPIRSAQLTELQSALDHARSVLLLPGIPWSVATGVPVRAADFTALRNGVR